MYPQSASEAFTNNQRVQLWLGDVASANAELVQPASLIFTPTTMANMESMLDFDNQTGFVDSTNDLTDESSQEWEQSSTPARTTHVVPTRKLPGPKSSCRFEDMTVEERARRQRRRERNKLAAARCRQRRVDLTNELETETKQLEAEAERLENEIRNLQRQRDQLQFVLEAHRPVCREVLEIKVEKSVETSEPSSHMATRPNSLPIGSSRVVPTSLPSISLSGELGFGFDLDSTGLTPVVSAAGYGVFLGAGSDFVSPTALMMSPSSLPVSG